jgi:hypothetical protein
MIYRFEWDEKKDAINIKKHGVSFEEAKMVFYDPKRFEVYDSEHSLYEDRWQIIGLSCCDILSVICSEKDGFIRIISARRADKKDEEVYFYGYSKTYN